MKIKNSFLGVVVFFMCTSTLSAIPFKISEANYQTMIEKSIVSTGNNARLKKVLAKICNIFVIFKQQSPILFDLQNKAY